MFEGIMRGVGYVTQREFDKLQRTLKDDREHAEMLEAEKNAMIRELEEQVAALSKDKRELDREVSNLSGELSKISDEKAKVYEMLKQSEAKAAKVKRELQGDISAIDKERKEGK